MKKIFLALLLTISFFSTTVLAEDVSLPEMLKEYTELSLDADSLLPGVSKPDKLVLIMQLKTQEIAIYNNFARIYVDKPEAENVLKPLISQLISNAGLRKKIIITR